MDSYCAKCFETFAEGSNVLPTPCGHIFHKICLSKMLDWMRLEGDESCPQCSKEFSKSDLQQIYLAVGITSKHSVPQNGAKTYDESPVKMAEGKISNNINKQGRPRGVLSVANPNIQPAMKKYSYGVPIKSSVIINQDTQNKENIPPRSVLKTNNPENSNKVVVFQSSNLTISTKLNNDGRPQRESAKRSYDTRENRTPMDEALAAISHIQPTLYSEQLELTNNVKWGTIIPLIGGSSIGCARSAGNLPAFHLTYTPFKNNETHLMRYWPKVPKYYLDKDQEPENMQGVDYINGVCPCAGLSMLNTSRTSGISRGSDAEMNKWMFQSAEYVLGRIKPKAFWGENAPGLFTTIGQGVVDGLRKLGEAYGYSFSLMKTNTELHGIPQKRIRTFYFFWNTPTVPELTYKYKKAKTFSNYLKEIPKSATQQDMFLTKGKASVRFRPYQFVLLKEGLTHRQFRHKYKKNGTAFTISQYLERNGLEEECMSWLMVHYPDEGMAEKKSNSRTHIEYIQHCRNKKAMGKGYWDDSPRFFGDSFGALMSKTMFTAVHPDEDRFLNIREMMHLMGLPHDFEIDNVKNFNHIAQNVPVHTAKDWADEVKLFCEGKLPMTDYSFIKQDNISQCIVANDGFHSDTDYEPFPKIKRTNKEQEPMVVKQEAMVVKQEPRLVKQEPSIVKQEPSIAKQEPFSSSDWLNTTESSIKTQNNTAQNNALRDGFLKQEPIVVKQEPLGINTQTYMKPHWSAQVTEPQIKQTNINQDPISAQFSIDPWGPKPQIKQTNLKQEPSFVKQEPLGISAKGYKIAYHTASGVVFQVKHPEVQIKQTNTDQNSVFVNKQPVEVKQELDMPLLEPSPSSSKQNKDIYLKDQESGFVKQEPGFVKQEPRIVKQEPVLVKQEPRIAKQEPGFVKQEPRIVKQEPRITKHEPGLLKEEPGFVKQEPGFVKQESGYVKHELGFVKQEPIITKHEPGLLKEEPGFVKQEPVEMNVPLYLDPRSNSRNEVIENVMAGLPMGKVVSFSFNDAFSKFLHKN